jgi:outer membrane protein TolC
MMVWAFDGTVLAELRERLHSGLTIDQAIQYGLDHYPSVRMSLARVDAARSGIDLTRTAYLPRVEMGFQQNMGTFNKASGVFFMTPYTPPIWGRQGDSVSYRGAWGSAAGTMAAWEPFDFGLRNANVESARAAERQTAAGVTLTQLDVGLGVGDAFFTVLMTQQTVLAMRGNVERRKVFSDTVNVLVKNGLRPGVDASRALAELAMARTQLIQAEQNEGIARATLAEVLGAAGSDFEIQPGPMLTLPGRIHWPWLKRRQRRFFKNVRKPWIEPGRLDLISWLGFLRVAVRGKEMGTASQDMAGSSLIYPTGWPAGPCPSNYSILRQSVPSA